jgi:hypothetical protein
MPDPYSRALTGGERLAGRGREMVTGTSEDLRASPHFTASNEEKGGLARGVRAACLTPFLAGGLRTRGGAVKW